MSEVTVEVDDAVLAVVGALLGTDTPEDTVRTALREVLVQRQRMAVLERVMVRSNERITDDTADRWRKRPAWR
ncbi:type II toxin-antitoxin system VapB family antitoxin [Nocardia arizonensis]|uniref:type II toxin-antitoxin system VapB family antitoxin n=1 Tax=Nocardia arizonensis TaxID=1141647 RepID=UPI0006CF7B44|nr:type II toxin-antitoxin system VapB family antitoxin [Nocardia arizonensis]